MRFPWAVLALVSLLPNACLVHGFNGIALSQSTRRNPRSRSYSSRFRTRGHLKVLPDDNSLLSLQQHLGDFAHFQPYPGLSHTWELLQHSHHTWTATTTATTALDSTSITTAKAAVSITNPPSWSSAFPEIPSVQDLEIELEEQAINSLGRDVLTFLAASVVVVPLARFLKVRGKKQFFSVIPINFSCSSHYFLFPQITPVLIFLAFGLVLGPTGLNTFSNTEADLQLGDFGILFLLFSEGLNLSPERLRNLGAFYGLGVLQILASMGLFFGGILFGGPLVLEYVAPVIHMDNYVYQMFSDPVKAFCIASAGALSSSAFVLPVLKAKGWENRPEGVAALSVLLLQDLAVAPLLVLLPLVAGSGPQSATELGILTLKATVGFGAVLAAGSVLLRYVFDVVAAARSTETFVAAALLVALGMGQAADALGLSATTGAFAAGVLLAGNRYRAQIKADVRPFEGMLCFGQNFACIESASPPRS